MAGKNDKNPKDRQESQKTQTAELKTAPKVDPKAAAGGQPEEASGSEDIAHTVDMQTIKPTREKEGEGENTSQTVGMESLQADPKTEKSGAGAGQSGQTQTTAPPTPEKKSNTAELQIVQQKKKEIEDRLKSQGTIRLTRPKGAPAPQAPTPAGGEAPKQSSPETYKVEPKSSGKTETTGLGTGATPTAPTGEGASKRTLKIKSGTGGAGGKTMKISGDQGKGTMKLSAQEQAAASGASIRPDQMAAGAAGPSGLGVFVNLVAMLASATAFTFLLLHYMDLYM